MTSCFWLFILFLLLTVIDETSCERKGKKKRKKKRKDKYTNDPLASRPNIVYFMADDLGWNDLGFNGASDVMTPHLDELARTGLLLNSMYVGSLCSPTRVAFLTGRYAPKLGFQGGNADLLKPLGLSLDEKLISTELKRGESPYRTMLVGKWHVGFAQWRYTPTYRDFDVHFGSLTGGVDKFTHLREWMYTDDDGVTRCMTGYDLRDQTRPLKVPGEYVTYLYRDKAMQLIEEHGPEGQFEGTPFFLWMSFEAAHAPAQCPPDLRDIFNDLEDEGRRRFNGMILGMDRCIEKMTELLKELGLWENTLIVFSSDNGANQGSGHSSNYPLRGSKATVWEGGVRVSTIVNGGVLNEHKRGHVYDGITHISDWLPTFVRMAGLKGPTHPAIDGFDLTEFILTENGRSEREEVLIDFDDGVGKCAHRHNGRVTCGALRYRNWKVVAGYRVDSRDELTTGWFEYPLPLPSPSHMGDPRIECGQANLALKPDVMDDEYFEMNCPYDNSGCLYDLSSDPCEIRDRKKDFPEIYQSLMDKLSDYRVEVPVALDRLFDQDPLLGNPRNHGGFWSPWKSNQVDD